MKNLSTLILIALAGAAGALASQVFSDPPPPPTTSEQAKGLDTREPVHFNEEQTHFALTQMRELLGTLVQLDKAQESNDFAALSAAAASQGPGRNAAHPAGFHEAMPDGFRAMSRQMRQSFGQAATAAKAGDLNGFVRAKREVQSACLACHETYRIGEQP